MSNIGLLITFTQLQAAPSAGHLIERSLVSGIPDLRDPSFREFPKQGNSYFRNFEPIAESYEKKYLFGGVFANFTSKRIKTPRGFQGLKASYYSNSVKSSSLVLAFCM